MTAERVAGPWEDLDGFEDVPEEAHEVRIDPAELHADEPAPEGAQGQAESPPVVVPDDPYLARAWELLCDVALETELVGIAILWPDALAELGARVAPADFTSTHLGRLWATARANAGGAEGPIPVSIVVADYRDRCPEGLLPEGKTHTDVISAVMAAAMSPESAGVLVRRLLVLSAERAKRLAAHRLYRAQNPREAREAEAALGMAEERGTRATAPVLEEPVSDLADVIARADAPEPDPCVEFMLARPAVGIIYGPPASGKSWAVMAMCLDLADGGGCVVGDERLQIRPLVTRYGGDPDVVLWIHGSEDTRARVERRMRQCRAEGPHAHREPSRGRFLVASPPVGVSLGTSAGLDWLQRTADEHHATVIVLDTIGSLTGDTLDASKNEQVLPFMVRLHRIRSSGPDGRVILLVHHSRKGGTDPRAATGSKADAVMGAAAWRAQTDTLVQIEAEDGQTSKVVHLRVHKAKGVATSIPPVRITLPPGAARFRVLEDHEDDTLLAQETGQAVAQESERRIGRPPRDHVAELQAAVAERGSLSVDEAPAALGISGQRWRAIRQSVIRGMLDAGYPVIAGEFVAVIRSVNDV